MKPTEVINQLKANSLIFENLLSDVSAEQIKYKPSEGKWSLLEIISHLYDEEKEDFKPRLAKILNEDSNWDPIDPQVWVISRNYMNNDFYETLNEFLDERKRSIDRLNGLEVKDWNVKAVHPKIGEFTAYQMLCNWLAHDYLHIRQILKLKYQYLEKDFKSGELKYAGEW